MMLELVVWDVQHGNAAYIKTPNNTHIVQDMGTGTLHGFQKNTFSPLLHLRSKYSVQQVDYVIVSHPHRDHISDIFNFDLLNPRFFCRPNHLSENDLRQGNQIGSDRYIDKYLEINRRYTNPVVAHEDPVSPINNGGVTIEMFTPRSCDYSNLNNHSIVTILTYKNRKIMIPGDNEPPSWEELLTHQGFSKAIEGIDVLVAPHHGRQSAFYGNLFNYFQPKLTIISDGPCETSAVNEYRNFTTGLSVNSRSRGSEERKCVTTRSDGVVVVRVENDWNSSLTVSID